MLHLSQADFKNFLLYRQGLIGKYQFEGKGDILSYFNRVHALQYDPVDLCGKNIEIMLNARIKNFEKEMLYDLLYKDQKLIEGYDKKLCVFSPDDWFRLTPVRYSKLNRRNDPQKSFQVENEILDSLHKQENVSVRSFNSQNRYKWYWEQSVSAYQIALERLFIEGKICIAYREGNIKYYTLNRLYEYNQTHNETLDDEYYKWHIKRRIESIGALWCSASPAWDYIPECTQKMRKRLIQELVEEKEVIELNIESIEGDFYCSTVDLEYLEMKYDGLSKRVEFLAPLDNFIWDRNFIYELFKFEYKWEIYTPEKERRFSSYCLPMLWGNEFVGRIDIKVQESHLMVRNIWIEKQIDESFSWLLGVKLRNFAKFNHCETIESKCIEPLL